MSVGIRSSKNSVKAFRVKHSSVGSLPARKGNRELIVTVVLAFVLGERRSYLVCLFVLTSRTVCRSRLFCIVMRIAVVDIGGAIVFIVGKILHVG